MNQKILRFANIHRWNYYGMIENAETGALESFNFEQLQKHVPEL